MDIKIIYVVMGWSRLANTKVTKYLQGRLTSLGYKVKYPDPDKVVFYSLSKLLGIDVGEVESALKRDDYFTFYSKFTNMEDIFKIHKEVLYTLHSDIFINAIIDSIKKSTLDNAVIIDKLNTYSEYEKLKAFCINNDITIKLLNPHSEHGNERNIINHTLSLVKPDYRFNVAENDDYMLKIDDIVDENKI